MRVSISSSWTSFQTYSGVIFTKSAIRTYSNTCLRYIMPVQRTRTNIDADWWRWVMTILQIRTYRYTSSVKVICVTSIGAYLHTSPCYVLCVYLRHSYWTGMITNSVVTVVIRCRWTFIHTQACTVVSQQRRRANLLTISSSIISIPTR